MKNSLECFDRMLMKFICSVDRHDALTLSNTGNEESSPLVNIIKMLQ